MKQDFFLKRYTELKALSIAIASKNKKPQLIKFDIRFYKIPILHSDFF
jgi:hypothetical protein